MSMKNLALDVESIALALSEEGGYEYYHIDDDIRELAKNVSDMQAENARLREQVDAAHMSRLLTENENESLRELVRDMMRYYFMPSAIDSKQRETELIERAHELGVEKDNGELGVAE